MFGLYQRRVPPREAGDDIASSPAIAVRAAELRQQQLAEVVAAREQAIGILGHELRNPLSAIAAIARSTLWRGDLSPDFRERLSQMDRAAQRSLAMIDSLRDFSEVRWRGTLPLHLERADPALVAEEMLDELRATYPGRDITLEVKRSSPMALDAVRLSQVVSNLVGNALIHGSPDEPVVVAVDVDEHEASLAVTNRGPCIPPERIAHLFEPFNHGNDNGGTQRSRGLGLGLYIVRVIVTAHGGTVTVTSHAQGGTTFLVRLPRR